MDALTSMSHCDDHDAVTAALVAALPTEQPLEMLARPLESTPVMARLAQIFAFVRNGGVRGGAHITARA